MDWTMEDNMVDGLFFCTTLTGCREGHTPFLQTRAEMSDTGAEAVEPDSSFSWEGHSERVGAGVGDESTGPRKVVQPLRLPLVVRPVRRTYVVVADELMSCAAGTNGCLDLRRRAFAPGGQVSADWSRCPGSMPRRGKESVAPLRRSSAGWMPTRRGRLFACVGCRDLVTIPKASFMAGSMKRV